MRGPWGAVRELDPLLRRNLLADVGVNAGAGLTMALVGVILPVVARREGVDALGLALFATAGFLANILTLFAGRVGIRSPRGLVGFRIGGGICLILMLVFPAPSTLVLLCLGFWLSIALASPYQVRLWGQIYPAGIRGRLVGVVGTGRAASAAAGALVGGLLADRIGGLQVIALGGVLGMVLGSLAWRLVVPPGDDAPPYDLKGSLRALTGSPRLRRVLVAQWFQGAGFVIAAPLYAFVHVDRLDLSLSEVGVLGILTAGATTLACIPWGGLVDRRGGSRVFLFGSVFAVIALTLYAWAPAYPVLWVAAIATGICNASVEIATQATIGECVPAGERTAAMAGWSAVLGIRGVIAPFIGTTLLALGVVDVAGGIAIGAASAVLGVLLFRSAVVRPVRSGGPAEAGRLAA